MEDDHLLEHCTPLFTGSQRPANGNQGASSNSRSNCCGAQVATPHTLDVLRLVACGEHLRVGVEGLPRKPEPGDARQLRAILGKCPGTHRGRIEADCQSPARKPIAYLPAAHTRQFGKGVGLEPSVYLNRFHYDTILHHGPALRYLRDLVGIERMVLGTDAPFPPGDPDALGSLRAADFSANEITQIAETNPRALFKALGG